MQRTVWMRPTDSSVIHTTNFLADELGECRNEEHVEDGPLDDFTNAEGELVVDDRADDIRTNFRKIGANGDDRSVDGDRQPVMLVESPGGPLEVLASYPDNGGGDRDKQQRAGEADHL